MATASLSTSSDLAFHVPVTGMSIAQFREWAESDDYPDRGKVVYYRGRLYFDMSPERIDSHAALKDALNRTLSTIAFDSNLGRYFPDGAGIQNEAAGVANEPDAYFAKWETIRSGNLIAPPEKQGKHTALVGTPDWVCEIVSDSSEEKDLKILRRAYFEAGIPEYWILDARGEEIRFILLTRTEEGYKETDPSEGWYHSPVFDLDFRLTRSRDQVGWLQYQLEFK